VNAALASRSGDPVPDRQVTFEVSMRDRRTLTHTATTNAEGVAQFTYSRQHVGSDTVIGRATIDGATVRDQIRHEWARHAPPPPREGILEVDSVTVSPGSDLRLSGGGCSPEAPVDVSVRERPVAVARADASGVYTVVATLPDLPLGRHTITATCPNAIAEATVDLVAHTATTGTAAAAGVTASAVLGFFVLLGSSLWRGVGAFRRRIPLGMLLGVQEPPRND